MSIFRDEVCGNAAKDRAEAKIIIAKNSCGVITIADLAWSEGSTKFCPKAEVNIISADLLNEEIQVQKNRHLRK